MMPRIVSGAALCVVLAIVAACASSPPSRFYTLAPTATAGAAGLEAFRRRRSRVDSGHRRPAADRR